MYQAVRTNENPGVYSGEPCDNSTQRSKPKYLSLLF